MGLKLQCVNIIYLRDTLSTLRRYERQLYELQRRSDSISYIDDDRYGIVIVGLFTC